MIRPVRFNDKGKTAVKTILKASTAAALLFGAHTATAADTGAVAIDGRWDAVLVRDGVDIPFRIDINGNGPTLKGVFYDGFQPYDGTTSATFQNGNLVLDVEHYLTTISARLENGQLTGTVVTQNRSSGAGYGFHAVRHVDAPAAAGQGPAIAGTWVIPLAAPSSKGEKAFRFIVEQRGPDVAASVLRIDGDTGAYSGAFRDGHWVLSHFDGGRPSVIIVTPKQGGTLEIQQLLDHPKPAAKAAAGSEYGNDATPDGRYAASLTAYRAEVAEAKGLPRPEDFVTHTTASNPNEVFKFNFPDSDGKLVSNDDPRFKGKVVLAVVTGTWCPNCHDEAQYLVQLDKKYRDKGVAIVALNFEEPEQQETLKRQRAFVKQYGVKYTYLLAGSPAQMWEKVPQLNHLDTWPATVFIGRDGKVKAVHSGFASPASGEFHTQLDHEFTTRIDQLLAEKPGANVVAAIPASSPAG
jgi:thiol-disulfide isomerase/thioredoxin